MDKEYFSNGGIPLPPLNFNQELNSISVQSSDYFLNTHLENSTDQYTQFNSALNSIISSPNSLNSNNSFPLHELIGKLGTICSTNNSDSTMASSYTTTPLNSPHKLHIPIMNQLGKDTNNFPNFGNYTNLGVSCGAESRSFSNRSSQVGLNNGTVLVGNGNLPRVSRQTQMGLMDLSKISCSNANSNEECSVSEKDPSGEMGLKTTTDLNYRKRKAISRGNGKKKGLNLVEDDEDGTREKRSKLIQVNGNKNGSVKMEEEKEKEKITEPVKDYIHVRARRGEATDSHSLAERVRREKIGQRMKLLQDLVPGCNKVTGKALMLDEIINYVQSLQRQVEFLSMKLATVNPTLDFHIDNFLAKDICQPNGGLPQNMFPLDGFGENMSKIPTICEDELQSIVQMGFNNNSNQELTLHSQNFHVPNLTSHMKIEM